ncbi:MAG: regulator [Paracoccus sp.]|nr:MAG: regulator [Paracoccus sp. (in: a-proteobacteria)]
MADSLLVTESTLTDRYQTTVPEAVRKALHLNKREKIRFTIQADGKVLLSRADLDESDPVLESFLGFLANDIKNNPQHVKLVSPELVARIQNLVTDVELDLDAPLDDEDD